LVAGRAPPPAGPSHRPAFHFQCSGPLTSCPAPPRAGVWPFQATSAARDRAEPLKSADVQITVGTRVRRERGHLRAPPSDAVTIYPAWRSEEDLLVRDRSWWSIRGAARSWICCQPDQAGWRKKGRPSGPSFCVGHRRARHAPASLVDLALATGPLACLASRKRRLSRFRRGLKASPPRLCYL